MKKAIVMLLTAGLIATMTACGGTKTEETTNNAKTGTGTTNSDAYDVTVIIKATDSDYWQSVLLGAEAAAEESDGKINITTAGPASETDVDEQVSILENAVSSGPDGIVIASISSDSTVPAVEEAVGKGIPVVTVDNKFKYRFLYAAPCYRSLCGSG